MPGINDNDYTLDIERVEYIIEIDKLIGIQGAKGPKGDTGDITPELIEISKGIYEAADNASNSAGQAKEDADEAELYAQQAKDAAEFAQRTCFYAIYTDEFNSSGETEYQLSHQVDTKDNIIGVNINNHNILDSNFELVDNQKIVLLEAPSVGSRIAIKYFAGKFIPVGAVFTNAFQFVQSQPATLWEVNHNLGRYPQVTVIDNDEDVCEAEVSYLDEYNLTIAFNQEMTGRAYMI